MSCGDLISCLSVFLEHNLEERTQLIFDLLDTNKDGTIGPWESKIYAMQCIDWDHHKSFPEIEIIQL